MLAVAVVGQRDQPVQDRGDLEHGVELPGRVLADRLDPEDQVEALVVQVRERVRRVDRQGGEDRVDLAVEVLVEVGVLGVGRGPRARRRGCRAWRAAGRSSLCQIVVLAGDEVVGPPGDLGELGERAHAVGRGVLGLEVVVELGLEAGDADLEELVEVRRRDRQEPEPLQERVRGVAGLFQDPLVEVEPAQLAVDEEAGIGRRSRGRRPGPSSVAPLIGDSAIVETAPSSRATAVDASGQAVTGVAVFEPPEHAGG